MNIIKKPRAFVIRLLLALAKAFKKMPNQYNEENQMETAEGKKEEIRQGCFAVKYENCVWAAFDKEFLVNYFHDVPNINDAVKFFEADPVFDEKNPLVDPTDRRLLTYKDANLRYIICDRSSLEFQLAAASKTDGLAVLSSEMCKIVVDQEQAANLLFALRQDTAAVIAEDDWYREHGDKSHSLYEEIYKALGTKIGKC